MWGEGARRAPVEGGEFKFKEQGARRGAKKSALGSTRSTSEGGFGADERLRERGKRKMGGGGAALALRPGGAERGPRPLAKADSAGSATGRHVSVLRVRRGWPGWLRRVAPVVGE